MKSFAFSFSQGNPWTFHLDIFENGKRIQLRTKTGLSWAEAKSCWHICSDYALACIDPTNALNFDDTGADPERQGLMVSEDGRILSKVTFGKKIKIEVLSEDSRRFTVIDFAHAAIEMFFKKDESDYITQIAFFHP